MALTVSARLPGGRYDAGALDPREAETVPSPFRLFCALAASAGAFDEPATSDVLAWLERQPLPEILVPAVIDRGLERSYVVTNRTTSATGNQSHPARTNGLRERAWVAFDPPTFAFHWPDTNPDAPTLDRLRRLSSSVPYLGRVTSTVRLTVSSDALTPADFAEHTVYRPVTLRDRGVDVLVPFDGCLDRLRELHERGDRAWEAARSRRYAPTRADTTQAGRRLDTVFEQLVVFRLGDGARIDGRHLVKLTSAVRAAAMSHVAALTGDDALPPALHGHDPTIPHVAFLGLPFVGHRHADGRLLGVVAALPSMASNDEVVIRSALTGAGGAPGLTRIEPGRVFRHAVELRYEPAPRHPHGLTERRWAGPPTGARHWVTATPVMLDRHVRPSHGADERLAEALVTAGYPEPVAVTVAPGPLTAGALVWNPRWRRHAGPNRPGRPVVHARVEFAVPVRGPVLAGSLRYLGVGLFAPAENGGTR